MSLKLGKSGSKSINVELEAINADIADKQDASEATTALAAKQDKNTAAVAVADLPAAASNVGRVLYCSNGSAGSPCAVISDGTNWKVIAIGATAAIE